MEPPVATSSISLFSLLLSYSLSLLLSISLTLSLLLPPASLSPSLPLALPPSLPPSFSSGFIHVHIILLCHTCTDVTCTYVLFHIRNAKMSTTAYMYMYMYIILFALAHSLCSYLIVAALRVNVQGIHCWNVFMLRLVENSQFCSTCIAVWNSHCTILYSLNTFYIYMYVHVHV